MSDLSTLAERLEAATEPDRKLDADLWWAFKRPAAERCFWNGALGLPRKLGENDPMPSGLGRSGCISMAPPYTASIDAALALVEAMLPPYGWSWRVQHTLGSERASIWREGLRSEWSISLTAPTAPLAILRALVAALAAQEGQR